MNILILGGTGAMGTPLTSILAKSNKVWVTSRKDHVSIDSIKYLKGNAKDLEFVKKITTEKRWDAIVDFMVRNYSEHQQFLPVFLSGTKQYVFISSARVYAESKTPIKEDTPRLLEACADQDYLKTNEYGLAKAKEEDLLRSLGDKNYTIIRPSITYNDYRLQLGTMEKESWLYRAIHGRSIVFSRDLADKITTMTYGFNVAEGIASIIGQERALGETYHITSSKSLPWKDVLSIYVSVLEEKLGRKVPIVWTEKSTNFRLKHQYYRIIYSRYFDRTFDNSKISQYVDVDSFLSPSEGLRECLSRFLSNPRFSRPAWILEGINDRVAHEVTPLSEITGFKWKLLYLIYRYNFTLGIWFFETIIDLNRQQKN